MYISSHRKNHFSLKKREGIIISPTSENSGKIHLGSRERRGASIPVAARSLSGAPRGAHTPTYHETCTSPLTMRSDARSRRANPRANARSAARPAASHVRLKESPLACQPTPGNAATCDVAPRPQPRGASHAAIMAVAARPA